MRALTVSSMGSAPRPFLCSAGRATYLLARDSERQVPDEDCAAALPAAILHRARLPVPCQTQQGLSRRSAALWSACGGLDGLLGPAVQSPGTNATECTHISRKAEKLVERHATRGNVFSALCPDGAASSFAQSPAQTSEPRRRESSWAFSSAQRTESSITETRARRGTGAAAALQLNLAHYFCTKLTACRGREHNRHRLRLQGDGMPTERDVEPPLSMPTAAPPGRVRTVRRDGPKPWAPGESPVTKRNLIVAGESGRLCCRTAAAACLHRMLATPVWPCTQSTVSDPTAFPAAVATVIAFAFILPATQNSVTPTREWLKPILGAEILPLHALESQGKETARRRAGTLSLTPSGSQTCQPTRSCRVKTRTFCPTPSGTQSWSASVSTAWAMHE